MSAVAKSGTQDETEAWDFFVSYTRADEKWAEWVAWQLEDAGYRVLIQAWDFVPGSNWRLRMHQGVTRATRTIALLSAAYLDSVYGQEEWMAVQAADPRGFERKLVPVRIEECPRPGLLHNVVSIDLFDRRPDEAQAYLLERVRHSLTGRAKPEMSPDIPISQLPSQPGARLRPPAIYPTSPWRPANPHGNSARRSTWNAQLSVAPDKKFTKSLIVIFYNLSLPARLGFGIPIWYAFCCLFYLTIMALGGSVPAEGPSMLQTIAFIVSYGLISPILTLLIVSKRILMVSATVRRFLHSGRRPDPSS
ncbi:toll/interleukin-1 receptor domain-containing protein [Parafrankia colletiae]|uniref:toll/interleukin-1 receptor domain-containing protein n=1 Tax=Parafrankia colletiae TaxID=573497 RepID=UPI0009FC1DC2